MPRLCAAYGCMNNSKKEYSRRFNISYHQFPVNDKPRLKLWLAKLNRVDFKPTAHSVLCSEHFTEEDFSFQPFTSRRGLKPNAVPSKFAFELPQEESETDDDGKSCSEASNNVIMPTKWDIADLINRQEQNRNSSDHTAEADQATDTYYPASMLEVCLKEFRVQEQLKILIKNSTQQCQDKKISILKEKLTSRVMKRALRKALVDAEIKAKISKKDYYERKKLILLQTKISDMEKDIPVSEANFQIMEDLKNQIMEEEIATKLEEKDLETKLFEAEMEASNEKRIYYDTKKTWVPFLMSNSNVPA